MCPKKPRGRKYKYGCRKAIKIQNRKWVKQMKVRKIYKSFAKLTRSKQDRHKLYIVRQRINNMDYQQMDKPNLLTNE